MSGRRSLRRVLLTSQKVTSNDDDERRRRGSDSSESDAELNSPTKSVSLPLSPLTVSPPGNSLSSRSSSLTSSSDTLETYPDASRTGMVTSVRCSSPGATLYEGATAASTRVPDAGYYESSKSGNNSQPSSPKNSLKSRVSNASTSSGVSTRGMSKQSFCLPDSALHEFILRACTLMALENAELRSRLEARQHEVQLEKLQEQLLNVNLDSAKQNVRSDKGSCMDSMSDVPAEDEEGGVLRKLNDMRQRLGFLKKRPEGHSSVRPLPEEAITWAQDFHNLMASKYGQSLFKAFLQREFSEENVEFWLAVEDYKNTRSGKLQAKASKIHNDYVAVQSPKEINLDPTIRSQITSRLESPDKNLFDAAQKRIQALMESDAYLRFLQSDLYKDLTHPEPDSNEDSS